MKRDRKPPKAPSPRYIAKVRPDDDGDSSTSEDIEDAGFLTLRRFFVAVNMLMPEGYEQVFSLTEHYPTAERAQLDLPIAKQAYPEAGIASAVLAFDPADPAQMSRYYRMLTERAEPAPGRGLS